MSLSEILPIKSKTLFIAPRPSSHRDAIAEVHHVLVEHAGATREVRLPDRLRLVGAVDAVERVLAILIEGEGAGAERAEGTNIQARRQIILGARFQSGHSSLRSISARPVIRAPPGRRRQGSASSCRRPHEVEPSLGRIDDEGADRLARREIDHRAGEG